MKNEIKEILDDMRKVKKHKKLFEENNASLEFSYNHVISLLDYITNLQEENERLKEILHWKQIEEEKKILEKLNKQHFHKKQRQLANKINEIIEYLKSKGE